MNKRMIMSIVIGVLVLSACARTPDAKSVTGNDLVTGEMEDQSIVHTPLGEFEVVSSRIVEQVHDYAAGPEEKIILVVLTEPGASSIDSDAFSLEAFEAMMRDSDAGEIYLIGSDGSKTTPRMGGWVNGIGGEFAIGFVVPKSVTSYQLFWWQDEPIVLHPVE